jgi:hypothetical protein
MDSDSISLIQFVKDSEWISAYEEASWLANEKNEQLRVLPLTRFGREGFCYLDTFNTWHVVFGKSNHDHFQVILHYCIDSGNAVDFNCTDADTLLFQRFSSALQKCFDRAVESIDSTEVFFDQFIRQNSDSTIGIFLLPAFQPSGQAIYGREWYFLFSKDGLNLLKQSTYHSAIRSIWIGQPRDIWINYRDRDKLTLGSVHFAWSFKDYFKRIHIDMKRSTITLSKEGSEKYSWKKKQKSE